MAELTNIERLQKTLQEYAVNEVPGDLDPWPGMQSRLVGTIPAAGETEAIRRVASNSMKPAREGGERRALRPSFSILPIMIIGVALLGLGIFAIMNGGTPGASKGYEFVPDGMVRHLVVSTEQVRVFSAKDIVGTPVTSTIDVWFANDPTGYLVRSRFVDYSESKVSDTADVWEIHGMRYLAVSGSKVVEKQVWPYPSIYAPNPNLIGEELQRPGARALTRDPYGADSELIIESDDGPNGKREIGVNLRTNRMFHLITTSENMTNTTKILVDELVEADTLPSDFFEFKLPEGYTLQEVMPTPTTSKGYEFVPVGTVRHLVVSTRQVGLDPEPDKSDVGAPITSTIEVWFANGPKDYLVRSHFAHYNGPGEPKISESWELDDMLYVSDPEKKIMIWQEWPYPSVYAPNPNGINTWLQRPDTTIISDTVMDGRPVIVIEFGTGIDDKSQMWIDKGTSRVFQWRDLTANSIHTSRVTVDELLDANTFAPDFFEFKLPEGYTLKERVLPTSEPGPTASVVP